MSNPDPAATRAPTTVRSPHDAEIALRAAHAQVDFDADGTDSGGWAMAPDALGFVRALIAETKATHIIEFGAGTSTVEAARALAELGTHGTVTTLENDPDAAVTTRAALDAAGVAAHADIVFAPLVARRVDGRHLGIYHADPGTFTQTAPPDVIVVDGPPSKLGGREGSLRQALSFAAVGTIVLLDDADRDEETAVLDAVERTHAHCVTRVALDGFARGLGALIVTGVCGVRFGEEHNDTPKLATTDAETDGTDPGENDPDDTDVTDDGTVR